MTPFDWTWWYWWAQGVGIKPRGHPYLFWSIEDGPWAMIDENGYNGYGIGPRTGWRGWRGVVTVETVQVALDWLLEQGYITPYGGYGSTQAFGPEWDRR